MAVFPWSKSSEDEKHPRSPPEESAFGPTETTDLGVVDEAEDDLHREMKPRQLSELLPGLVLRHLPRKTNTPET